MTMARSAPCSRQPTGLRGSSSAPASSAPVAPTLSSRRAPSIPSAVASPTATPPSTTGSRRLSDWVTGTISVASRARVQIAAATARRGTRARSAAEQALAAKRQLELETGVGIGEQEAPDLLGTAQPVVEGVGMEVHPPRCAAQASLLEE